MKDFDEQKRLCLEKLYLPDKSRKGDVDIPIIPLIDYINSLNNYYTTSSCSGRIMLLTHVDKKPDVQWLLASHEVVTCDAVLGILHKDLPKETVWLREENLILHVVCRTMEDADNLLRIVRDIGLRRSGIIADSNLFIVEICSTEKMDVPLTSLGKLIVDDSYIIFVVDIANQKFVKGQEKLQSLEKEIREKLG